MLSSINHWQNITNLDCLPRSCNICRISWQPMQLSMETPSVELHWAFLLEQIIRGPSEQPVNTTIPSNSLEAHTYFHPFSMKREQSDGSVLPLARQNCGWVMHVLFTEVSESRGLRLWFGTGPSGVQLSRCSHSCPLDLPPSGLLCYWPHFLFGAAAPPSVLLTTALSLNADCSLALLNPSLCTPSDGLSCLPWKGASLHPKRLRPSYKTFQTCSLWTLAFQRLWLH